MKKERSLVLIKPDGVQRTLIGEIIKRYERSGLKLIGLKMLLPNREMVESHYMVEPNWKEKTGQKTIESYEKKGETPPSDDPEEMGSRILEALVKYLVSGPVVAMIWEGMNAVGVIRKLTGDTQPMVSDVGTIRGDFTLDSYKMADMDNRSVRNLVHASSSTREAENEIEIWFDDDEVWEYTLAHDKILYDVNLDGILE